MAKELTRNGVVGLELTREEVIDLAHKVRAVGRKAACREVNGYVLDMLADVSDTLDAIDNALTEILEIHLRNVGI